jgi:predicted GIY-YIG superfamily endonuclease
MIYKVAYIYTIESADGCLIYIGSTCDFKQRMRTHRSFYKKYLKSGNNYCSSFDIIKDDGYNSFVLETHFNIDKEALRKREGEIIRSCKCVNKKIEGQSQQEYDRKYKLRNADKIKQDKINYYHKNAAKINTKRQSKHQCSCGGKYTYNHKARHKQTLKHTEYVDAKLEAILKESKSNFNEVLQELLSYYD